MTRLDCGEGWRAWLQFAQISDGIIPVRPKHHWDLRNPSVAKLPALNLYPKPNHGPKQVFQGRPRRNEMA